MMQGMAQGASALKLRFECRVSDNWVGDPEGRSKGSGISGFETQECEAKVSNHSIRYPRVSEAKVRDPKPKDSRPKI